ncbi:MAG: hypothetical protein GY750_20925 [Lentisphaerae bacterium]|nr:hypothetical protein [Lentisphaerota bacterium]
MDRTIAGIMSFWKEIGLYRTGNVNKQLAKVREEFTEVTKAFCLYMIKADEKRRANLQKEIGDLFISLLNFCEILGFDIEECAILSHEKNEKRNYYMVEDECVRDK